MTLSRHHAFRVLAAVFCSFGVAGVADGTLAMWTLVTLATFTSAVLLTAAITKPSLAPAPAHVEVIR